MRLPISRDSEKNKAQQKALHELFSSEESTSCRAFLMPEASRPQAWECRYAGLLDAAAVFARAGIDFDLV
ncbi:hypothetical protein, partial [Duodenibacillus massiliensis]|uniref:hypothetical protein n=1 Tax=Duodenibacillus massiliensis TaxID=1852381 RepID=UPI00307E1A3D